MKLTEDEKAEILLEHLSKLINVDWNMEDYYLKFIKSGLREIDRKERKENKKAD